ncbi:MAG TPA: AarF/UbiB family protein [Pyrinomonadaceae bacterium]|jgi:predicted unusual protein kinase regulating ubiquinone biosynthesis (AarF/ABC1/UbiB family)|nr:AarF/UbiB family protein [Pyrinomonadaceae bacterium]
MPGRGHKAADVGVLKTRRAEVAARLAAYGLARGPRRVLRASPSADASEGFGRRLRLALEGLGPVFASFGLYLATRVDLLDARDCLELAAIRDRAAPLPAAAAHELLRDELGLAPHDAFAEFDGEPFESRLLYQAHRARLRDGTPAAVKLVRPDASREFLRDVELLDLLEDAGEFGGVSFKDAAADFAAALGGRLDLTCEAQALESLACDAEGFDALAVPAVERGLCSAKVLTTEELSGRRLDGLEICRGLMADAARDGRGPLNSPDRAALARLLCSVWLRQALLGHTFPAEPLPSNVLITYDGRVAFTGGLFASLHADEQKRLWNYLIATAAENPDRACSALLGELRFAGRGAGDEDLRHRFRQVVPFRDTGWHRDDDTSRLSDHLVVHWRSAAECGYVPRPHLPPFYRGLFTVSTLAQQLSPEIDPLLEGLQDARLQESLARVREMFSLRQLGDNSDRYAAMMMGMPGKIDEMLTLASEGGMRLKVRAPDTPSGRNRQNSAAAVTALLLLLAGAVVLLPRVTAAFAGEAWANRVGTFVFILLGALVLRAAGRTA